MYRREGWVKPSQETETENSQRNRNTEQKRKRKKETEKGGEEERDESRVGELEHGAR